MGPSSRLFVISWTYDVFGIRFTDLTGTDYSGGAVDLARSLAERDGFTNLKFLVSF